MATSKRPAKAPGRAKTLAESLETRFPGLAAKVQKLIEESERRFAGNAAEADGSFLWEHTLHVASLAFKIALEEKADAPLAAAVALFHDAGKFAGGTYHADDRAEEEGAARLAEETLAASRVRAADRKAVAASLRALYSEGAGPNAAAAIVHDADFLSKAGRLGVAQFFVKSTLRGRPLGEAVLASLGKEMTYAACLPLNMRTRSGRAMAERKAADALAFYEAFLRELGEARGADYRVVRRRLPHPKRPGTTLEIRLVLPGSCPACGGEWSIGLASAPGLKCETLEARARCVRCGAVREVAFCLPELAGPAA